MHVVVDTSAIIAIITNESSKSAMIDATIDSTLVAPDSLHWEVGNALTSLIKRNRISLDVALIALRSYEKIPIRLVNVDLEQSVRLAKEMGINAYDAYVLVCADTLKYPLLSLDGPMVKLAKDRGIKLVEVDIDA